MKKPPKKTKRSRLDRVFGPPTLLPLDKVISLADISTDQDLFLHLTLDEEAPGYVQAQLRVRFSTVDKGIPRAWREEERATGIVRRTFTPRDVLRSLATKAAFALNDRAAILASAASSARDQSAAEDLHRLIQGRIVRQELGARANKQKGARHRKAIVRLAKEIRAQNREMKLSDIARAIEQRKDPDLRLGENHFLKRDGIRKHLSSARKAGLL